MKTHCFLVVLAAFFCLGQGYSQTKNLDDLHPVSPTAFQFLKYDEMPVSEYTGIPNISIPLYEIGVDGVQVPVNLNYHAVGVRVNQESSWVGIGWDMNVGSIVQTVNDVDDYAVNTSIITYKKMMPDYANSPLPSEFPLRYQYPFLYDGYQWYSPVPVNNPQIAHSYKIATDYYVPVNGDFDTKREELFTSMSVDSEPDIFKANFLGHSLNFILDFKTGNLVILNKRGYKLSRYGKGWKIVTPNGEEFYFDEVSEIRTLSSITDMFYNSYPHEDISSRVWMLTKIVTKNGRQINLGYKRTTEYSGYPNYSQKWQKVKHESSLDYRSGHSTYVRGFLSQPDTQNPLHTSIFTSKESYVYWV